MLCVQLRLEQNQSVESGEDGENVCVDLISFKHWHVVPQRGAL